MNKEKIYVKVDSTFDPTGFMQPTSITWSDGRTFPIETVRDFRPAGTADNGYSGDCFTVLIQGQEKHLFFEHRPSLHRTAWPLVCGADGTISSSNERSLSMTIFEKLRTLAEITDQDEMIKACKIIPDEELRLALVVLALAYNKNEQSNREIFHRQTQEVDSLKEKIKELEKASK